MCLLLQATMLAVFFALDVFLFYGVLGDHAGADVLHHRHLGRRTATLRGDQVLPLYAGRFRC